MGKLQDWLDADWLRIGADGSIKGKCGDRKKSEGKPKCLPRKKAMSLSKEERMRDKLTEIKTLLGCGGS